MVDEEEFGERLGRAQRVLEEGGIRTGGLTREQAHMVELNRSNYQQFIAGATRSTPAAPGAAPGPPPAPSPAPPSGRLRSGPALASEAPPRSRSPSLWEREGVRECDSPTPACGRRSRG